MRIAIIDEDPMQLDAVAGLAESAGHTCQGFTTHEALLGSPQLRGFDLFVMAWTPPGAAALATVARLKAARRDHAPILLLTSGASAADLIRGLNAGADAYVARPADPRMLAAKMNSLLRRADFNRQTDHPARLGGYVFDRRSRRLVVDGEPIEVTAKEFDLALLLFQNLDRDLSRAFILEAAWTRNPDLRTRTLDMHISRLRTKLNLRPENGFRLAPVYRHGYRLERFEPPGRQARRAGARR